LGARSWVHGRFPFDQKFRKFRVKSEWKGHFPESHFGILGVPRELVPIFRKIGITEKFCSIRPFLLGPVSPRPKLSTWLPQCQTFQPSRFHRETHGLGCKLTVSRFCLLISRWISKP